MIVLESDYIIAGDVKIVTAAESVLRDICPPNNEYIPANEYRLVMSKLQDWREAMFKAIETEEDPAQPGDNAEERRTQ